MSFQTEHNMQDPHFSANLKSFGLKTEIFISREAAWSREGVGQKKKFVIKIMGFGILILCQNFQNNSNFDSHLNLFRCFQEKN